jgi:PhnB protein
VGGNVSGVTDAPSYRPEGWSTLTPRIVAEDAAALVDFLRRVFAAEGEIQPGRPAELRIGDSRLMVSGAGERDAMPAFLYVYVPDADATFQRAIANGAQSVEDPRDTPYGDRRAMVRDRWGNVWQIATRTT